MKKKALLHSLEARPTPAIIWDHPQVFFSGDGPVKPIYLDNASTTRVDPRVVASMMPFLEGNYANPSSHHSAGREGREAMERARAEIASLVGCEDEEVVLVSSATEANNLALKGVCRARGRRGRRLLVSAVEHPSVLHSARTLTREGFGVTELPVDRAGRLECEGLRGSLDSDVALVSVMHGNPEVGTLQPVAEIARMTKEAGSLFHTDATLTAGLFPALWREAPIDLMTLSPHLFHGPKGIAALVVRKGVRLLPQVEGGTQEAGLRAGTEPVVLVVGFGAAARLAREEAFERCRRLSRLGIDLRRRLEDSLEDWVPTGDATDRIPGHFSLCLRYVEGEAVLASLDDEGVLAGSGSACTREVMKESHVLEAMGIDTVLARGSLHFSFGAFSRDEEPEAVARILPGVVERLRRISPFAPAQREPPVRKGGSQGP